jgi:hypothetical protein
MPYTLITPVGRVYTFYIEAVAQTYQQAYGGIIVTAAVLVDSKISTAV